MLVIDHADTMGMKKSKRSGRFACDPLPQAGLDAKFGDNCAFGGWPAARADMLREVTAESLA